MPKRVYDQLKKSNKKITKTSVKLYGYRGHDIPVIGTIRLDCSINNVKKSTDFYVALTKNKTILGLKSCRDTLVKINEMDGRSQWKFCWEEHWWRKSEEYNWRKCQKD